jgi:bud emergence protein 1
VPVNFFQALGRTERDSAQSQSDSSRATSAKNPDHDSGYAETSTTGGSANNMPNMPNTQRLSKSGKSGGMVYGIVMYDFQAERADELEAKAGEAIIVIAQSNPEWFVAKPIGRLGGPGLIPVSFIEIRDMATNTAVPNPGDAVRRAGIPRVEEWKKMAADYKNSSITLGKFEAGGAPPQPSGASQQSPQQSIEQGMDRMSLQQAPRASQPNGINTVSTATSVMKWSTPAKLDLQQRPSQQSQQSFGGQRPAQPQQQVQTNSYAAKSTSQLYAPISARIPRYCFAEDKYWFVIEAVLEDRRHWELSRYYEDFYDFQIALLTEFPVEAGNTNEQKRTLPYMPGPVNYVTDAITEGRLHNLDAYVKNLLAQPEYISKCQLVRQFFSPREGDYEIDPNEQGVDYRLSGVSQPSSTESPGGASRQGSRNNLNGNGYGGMGAGPNRQPGGPNGQPGMTRQTSSLSQPSQSSLSPAITQAGAAMKVKLSYNGDFIALRVPSDIQYRDLYDRIRERLRLPASEQMQLSYKDESTGDKLPMISNNDLDLALQRNEKLLLFVE